MDFFRLDQEVLLLHTELLNLDIKLMCENDKSGSEDSSNPKVSMLIIFSFEEFMTIKNVVREVDLHFVKSMFKPPKSPTHLRKYSCGTPTVTAS